MESKGKLKLGTPLLVLGVETRELEYDFDKLTSRDMMDADNQRANDLGRPAWVPAIDRATQLILFALAAEKTGSGFTREDIPRMSYKDAVRAAALSRDFTNAEADDAEDEDLDTPEAPREALVLGAEEPGTEEPNSANPTEKASEGGVVPISRKRSGS